MLELHILFDVIAPGNVLEVLVYLGTARVELAPVRVRGECKLVAV